MGRGRSSADEDETPARQRLDKWIWFARFQRSREACAALIKSGHVRVDGRRERSPGAFVRIGTVLTLALPGQTEIVQICGLAERRGDSSSAERLFLRIGDHDGKPSDQEAVRGLIDSLASEAKAH